MGLVGVWEPLKEFGNRVLIVFDRRAVLSPNADGIDTTTGIGPYLKRATYRAAERADYRNAQTLSRRIVLQVVQRQLASDDVRRVQQKKQFRWSDIADEVEEDLLQGRQIHI